MESDDEFVARVKEAMPNLKQGSLVVWGDIFGGRIDNVHQVVDAVVLEDDCVQVLFNLGERLTIWQPDGLTATHEEFLVERASRVRWEWFYYGREQSPENLYFIEHLVDGERVEAFSNVDWYDPSHAPSLTKPAVELVGGWSSV